MDVSDDASVRYSITKQSSKVPASVSTVSVPVTVPHLYDKLCRLLAVCFEPPGISTGIPLDINSHGSEQQFTSIAVHSSLKVAGVGSK